MEVKLRQVSKEASENSWNILQIFLHWAQVIPSMSDGLVRRVLHI